MVSVYKFLTPAILIALSLLSVTVSAADAASVSEETTKEVFITPTVETLASEENVAKMQFQEPQLVQSEVIALEQLYSYVDPSSRIGGGLKRRALAYYHANLSRLANKRYLTVADFSLNSSRPRMFIINMKSGAVTALHMAHGKGSDLNNDGYADRFSNKIDSEASSLGAYRTGESYNGEHGLSLRLDGLSPTNSNARRRAVVIHGATYVRELNIKAGRSWGCLAVPSSKASRVVEMLKGGSLVYAGH